MEFIKIKQPTFKEWHKKNFKLDREPLDKEVALEVCKSCNLKTIEIV